MEPIEISTIPQATLYAPCTTSISSVSSPTATQSLSDPDRVDNSNSTALAPTSFDEDGKMTTVSEGVTIVVSEYVTTINGVATIVSTNYHSLREEYILKLYCPDRYSHPNLTKHFR
jgi:hypothetical protein